MHSLLAKAQSVFGYVCTGGPEGKMIAGEPLCTLQDFFGMLYKALHFIMVVLAPLLVVAAIIYGSFLIILYGTNPERLGQGKNIIWNAVFGLVIVWGAWAIVNTVFYLFDISIPCPQGGTFHWYQITC